jgi:hypothetical protein
MALVADKTQNIVSTKPSDPFNPER